MSMDLEINKANLRSGDQLKIKGHIPADAYRFVIALGSSDNDQALNFSPRYDEGVTVINSCTAGTWGQEKRTPISLQRGTDVKIVVKLRGGMFDVELPNGEVVQFPNRVGMTVFNWVKIKGSFELKYIKIL